MSTKYIQIPDSNKSTSTIGRYSGFYGVVSSFTTTTKRIPNYSVVTSAIVTGEFKYTSNKSATSKYLSFFVLAPSETANSTSYNSSPYKSANKNFNGDNFTALESDDIKTWMFPHSGSANAGYIDSYKIGGLFYATYSSYTSASVAYSIQNCSLKVDYTPPKVTISASVEGGGTVSGAKTLTLTEPNTSYSTTLKATPSDGYEFEKWSDGVTSSSRTVSYSDNDITSANTAVSYKAIFKKTTCIVKFVNYDGTVLQSTSYSLGETPAYNGSTPARPSNEQFNYSFLNWSPRILAITEADIEVGEKVYTAQYLSTIRTYSISSNNTIYGYVDGVGNYAYGSEITLAAIPYNEEIFEFSEWTDGVTDNPRTVIVTGDAKYNAIFRLKPLVFYDTLFNGVKWLIEGIEIFNEQGENIDAIISAFPFECGIYLFDHRDVDSTPLKVHTSNSPIFTVTSGTTYVLEYTPDEVWNFEHTLYVMCDDTTWSTNSGRLEFTVPNNCTGLSLKVEAVLTGTDSNEIILIDNLVIYPVSAPYMSETLNPYERINQSAEEIIFPSLNEIEGYEFVGWFTGLNGMGEQYTEESEYPSEDLILWSYWVQTSPNITDVQMLYNDSQISSSNKVMAGQGYIIKVKIQ